MKRLALLIFGFVLLTATANGADEKSRAEEILNQTRQALGGASKLNAIHALTASLEFRRVIEMKDESGSSQTMDQSGDMDLDLLLPDKYMRSETTNLMGDARVTIIRAVNGDQTWSDTRTSGPGMIIVREAKPQGANSANAGLRGEFYRYLVAWLLAAPASEQLEYSYAGQAEADDGSADVIDVKGADGFSLRLFLDSQTHLPLMLSYKTQRPRGGRMINRRMTREPMSEERIAKEHQEGPEPEMVEAEIQERFSDYRKVDGLMLPHHISRATDGKTDEEWEIKQFKINPDLKPEKFVKK